MDTWGKKTLCLVTGASRGIGREIAIQFSQKISPDSTIILSARSEPTLAETSTLILKVQPKITIKHFVYDLSKPKFEDFKQQLAGYASTEWDLFLLVHNAGFEGSGRLIKDCDNPEEWQVYMNINLHSMVSLTSAFLKTFEKDDKMIIVNITSLAAIEAFSGLGEYSVGKAAREMYMKTLAAENPKLRLFNYSPGPVATDMIDRVIENVKSSDSKEMFDKMRREESLVKAEDTVNKLVKVIGDGLPPLLRVDYFDR